MLYNAAGRGRLLHVSSLCSPQMGVVMKKPKVSLFEFASVVYDTQPMLGELAAMVLASKFYRKSVCHDLDTQVATVNEWTQKLLETYSEAFRELTEEEAHQIYHAIQELHRQTSREHAN